MSWNQRNLFPLVVAVGLCWISVLPLFATERLAGIFADNMVLQRDATIPVWGWAKADQVVTVKFSDQKKTAKADQSGRWLAYLDPAPANKKPQSLQVIGESTQTINNVLVGDVWVCSGQSNSCGELESAYGDATAVGGF